MKRPSSLVAGRGPEVAEEDGRKDQTGQRSAKASPPWRSRIAGGAIVKRQKGGHSLAPTMARPADQQRQDGRKVDRPAGLIQALPKGLSVQQGLRRNAPSASEIRCGRGSNCGRSTSAASAPGLRCGPVSDVAAQIDCTGQAERTSRNGRRKLQTQPDDVVADKALELRLGQGVAVRRMVAFAHRLIQPRNIGQIAQMGDRREGLQASPARRRRTASSSARSADGRAGRPRPWRQRTHRRPVCGRSGKPPPAPGSAKTATLLR